MKGQTSLLFEVSGEVCFKMGGIHTVIVSKIPYVKQQWGDRYFLIGAFVPGWNYEGQLQEIPDEEISQAAVRKTVLSLRNKGVNVLVGTWQVEGCPLVILLHPHEMPRGFAQYKAEYLATNNIKIAPDYDLVNLYISFGYYLECFFREIRNNVSTSDLEIIVHFHEYMTTVAVREIKKLHIYTVFTTHATIEGRYWASLSKSFHHKSVNIDWNIGPGKMSRYYEFCKDVERIAARTCDVFTAVSSLTAAECRQFLGRDPDVLTPNGLSTKPITREPVHASSVREYINQVVACHFPGLVLNGKYGGGKRKKVLYFFSAGRYEYKNKGFNLIVEALAKLNQWIAKSNKQVLVVMFFITDAPYPYGSPIRNKVKRLIAGLMRSFRGPDVFLHKVPATFRDSLLVKDITRHRLLNRRSEYVKVLYHPEFLSLQSPSLKMDYADFIKGCDLGIFPSYYEPWGYTPQECITAGIPTVTSNMTGFGQYINSHTAMTADSGVFVIDWNKDNMAHDLYEVFKKFILEEKDYRPVLAKSSGLFDWEHMIAGYHQAYEKAVQCPQQLQPLGSL